MLALVARIWVPAVILIGACIGIISCGGSDGPEPPDTAAVAVMDYLRQVDYQGSTERVSRTAGAVSLAG